MQSIHNCVYLECMSLCVFCVSLSQMGTIYALVTID